MLMLMLMINLILTIITLVTVFISFRSTVEKYKHFHKEYKYFQSDVLNHMEYAQEKINLLEFEINKLKIKLDEKKKNKMNEYNEEIGIEPKIVSFTIDYDFIKKRFKQEGLLTSEVKDLFDKIELELRGEQ